MEVDEQEAFKLLTLASLRDNRTVTQMHAQAWAADLGDVAYRDAEGAVSAHYADTSDWMMPAHVRAHARAAREQRLRAAREQQRAITNASAEAEWQAEKTFRDEHGMSRLAWAMKQLEDEECRKQR